MKTVSRIVLGIIVPMLPAITYAQNVITGRIVDAQTNEPLIGASAISNHQAEFKQIQRMKMLLK